MKLSRSQIITHRGLEPDRPGFFSESSYEAFADQLARGFGGIEFDPNFTRNGEIIVVHDAGLGRFTDGRDTRTFATDVTANEVRAFRFANGRIPFFTEVIELIRANPSARINALHLKGRFQETKYLALLVAALKDARDVLDRIVVFDVRPATARFLARELPELRLSPSVAHPYDIERYGAVVGNTLLSIEEALGLKAEGLIAGVWLDEWDLADRDGDAKTLYNADTFARLRAAGLEIYLVTPELHGTSPGLYGGESHPDAASKAILYRRIKEIIRLGPDGICTDHPEEVLLLDS